MFGRFASFEFRYQTVSPMFAVVVIVFGFIALLLTAVPEVGEALAPQANINSPFVTVQILAAISVYAVFIPTAFLSGVVLRDRHFGTEELFFTRPVREFDYLAGRFAGAFAACALAFLVVPAAMFFASSMPWLDPAKVGPDRPLDYLYAYAVFGLPNLLIPGALMFTVANLSRSTMATYTALVVFLALYLTASTVFTEPEQLRIAALADPLGAIAAAEVTRYWTPVEMNTQLPPLEGTLLWNRILWLGVAFALLAVNLRVFSFRARGWRFLQRRGARAEAAPAPTGAIAIPHASPAFGAGAVARQFLARLRYEIGMMVRSVTFWVLLALGVVLVLAVLFNMQLLFGTPLLPVTRVIAGLATQQFAIVPIIVLIYFAGELVWRDRVLGAHEILDSSPTPSWVFVLTKLCAMWLMLAALFGVAILTGIGAQLALGAPEINLGLYLSQMLVITAWQFYLLATLSIFFQVVANNRYLGMFLMIGFLLARAVIANMGFGHNLYVFGGTSGAPYSDLGGYGHFLTGLFWFELYWTLFAAILVTLAFALWNRGALTPIWRRAGALPRRLGGRGLAALGALVLAFGAVGGFIFYNTNVVNRFFYPVQLRNVAETYEERYRQFEDAPEPTLAGVDLDVDIYPRDRRYVARGTYTLRNDTGAPLETMHLDYDYPVEVREQTLEGGSVSEEDEIYSFYTLAFDEPLQPGEERALTFEVARDWEGFAHGNGSFVLWNGTFFNNMTAFPRIGFAPSKMIQATGRRRSRGLEPIDRMAPLEDADAAQHNYISPHSGWMDFEATVSTSPDQIAIAPGTLQREWTEDGRRYFHYRMETPILNFYAFLSARYAVAEETRDGVLLQVFHHPDHTYNVDRMLETMGDSIAYFSEAFSPFQHPQMRIFEFPAFLGEFAQSFPNSVPYSEGVGFIMDNRDPDDIDYVYYITAHEVAHQWWAHQIVGAATQGATMLSETFSQYSALMLMEKEFGEHHIRRFLKYELDRYLLGRGTETREELPLYRVENQQHIHYQKGSLVMYALQDYLGEDVVNRALSRLLEEHAYQTAPYPQSTDFLRILREEAGPGHEELIADLFEKIVLFDLKATGLEVEERADGRFDVALTVEARKLEADGEGAETEVPLDYMIDIGLFSEHPDDVNEGDDHVLVFEKRRVTDGETVFTFVTDAAPEAGGIDPYIKLIDRVSDDNLIRAGEGRTGGEADAEEDQTAALR